MKLKQSFHLVLIALFVWSFQSRVEHIQHHDTHELSECKVCHEAEEVNHTQHHTPMAEVHENLAVKTRREARQQVVVAERFDYMEVSQPMRVETVVHCQCDLAHIPLGFDSTAPPLFIS